MAPASRQPAASVHRDIQQAVGLLQRDPSLAKQKAEEILAQYPDLDAAQQILGVAWRLLGDPLKALTIIEPLAHRQHDSADLLHELGLCLGAAGRGADAVAVLRKAVQRHPKHAQAWRSLGDQLNAAGHEQAAEEAFDRHLTLSARHPELIEAADLLRKGAIAKAERLTREVLKKDPVDVMAIRMLAAIGIKVGQLGDAGNLLERCLELAPGFHLARHAYAVVLFRRNELEQALEQVEALLKAEPNNPNFLILKGTILVRKGDHLPALELYERLLENYPGQSGAHMNYGHTLKTIGRVDDAINEYRTSIGLRPATGEAYWSLANLKTFHFSDEDIENMRAQIVPEGGDPEDQAHLAFALGKALEDRQRFDESFRYYALGNAVRRQHHRFSAKINVVDTARQIRTLDRNFFEERRGWGCRAPEPIFVVGLPRAGSTLLEQILASHSQVEGTAELPDIIAMSRKLGKKSRKNPASDYPEVLATLSEEQVCELGESYMSTTQVQRRGAPFFIDKMPNNFHHIGLIHLILPNAKIIDARRHPMAGCFSCFKQLFARGQTFTYDLTDLGRYYRDYMALMDHWDTVLPGRVHRVQYEQMVADSESEIRRLLEYCGLEFEEQCLRFYETERAVRTPSSEQVRRPIYKEGVEQWRHYEKHLEPLKKALGPVLDRYPID
jgi:tetratricopeptide (TPR) repeat protein